MLSARYSQALAGPTRLVLLCSCSARPLPTLHSGRCQLLRPAIATAPPLSPLQLRQARHCQVSQFVVQDAIAVIEQRGAGLGACSGSDEEQRGREG